MCLQLLIILHLVAAMCPIHDSGELLVAPHTQPYYSSMASSQHGCTGATISQESAGAIQSHDHSIIIS